jgi:dUTP pyrophosphatase
LIKVILKRGNNLETQGFDSGFDLAAKGYSRIVDNKITKEVWFDDKEYKVTLKPNETILIKTGVHLELPEPEERLSFIKNEVIGHNIMEAQIRNRSGLALKDNTYVKWGTIDNKYRGDCGISFWNNSDKEYVIKKDERIAQLVFNPVYKPVKGKGMLVVEELEDTERGENGFGHTGK